MAKNGAHHDVGSFLEVEPYFSLGLVSKLEDAWTGGEVPLVRCASGKAGLNNQARFGEIPVKGHQKQGVKTLGPLEWQINQLLCVFCKFDS